MFVWSSGNGGVSFDSCAYDGYVNNIRTISVAAIGRNGAALYGGERCSANMVTAYSKDGGDDNYPIVSVARTAFVHSRYSNSCFAVETCTSV